jgi:hypothetical protein
MVTRLTPWERYEVERVWVPRPLRCLIVGEGPGFHDTSPYFYEPHPRLGEPKEDPVEVRGYLLDGLHTQGLIEAPTLEAFRDDGFLFDHALRAPTKIPAHDRTLAKEYRSPLVGDAGHLRPWLRQAPAVWVMGHYASQAVWKATGGEFPPERRSLSRRPYEVGSRFFVSQYLNCHAAAAIPRICAQFAGWLGVRGGTTPKRRRPTGRTERDG